MLRQSVENALPLAGGGILSHHLRRDRPKGEECYRKSHAPSALLLSRIRNNPLRRLAAPPLPKGEAFGAFGKVYYRLSLWESCQR